MDSYSASPLSHTDKHNGKKTGYATVTYCLVCSETQILIVTPNNVWENSIFWREYNIRPLLLLLNISSCETFKKPKAGFCIQYFENNLHTILDANAKTKKVKPCSSGLFKRNMTYPRVL